MLKVRNWFVKFGTNHRRMLCALMLFLAIGKFSLTPVYGQCIGVRPEDFGANPTDQVDDTAALEAAITSINGGQISLCLSRGTYLITPHVSGGVLRFDGVSHLTIVGQGIDTTIIKVNPQFDGHGGGDPHIFRVDGSSNVEFRDFSLDGSRFEARYQHEQAHGIYIRNSTHILIERVKFYHLRGDGIFTIGSGPDSLTQDVAVRNCIFLENGRSGIANQGGVRDLNYENNWFESMSDQNIDIEPTGKRPAPEYVWITNNTMLPTRSGAAALAIAGYNDRPAKVVRVEGNTIHGRVILGKTQDLEFANNTVVGTVQVRHQGTDVRLVSNYIEASESTNLEEDAAVRIIHHNDNRPNAIIITGNVLVQRSSGNGIGIQGAGSGIEVTQNYILGAGVGSGIKIWVAGEDGLSRRGYRVSDNWVLNFSQAILVSVKNSSTRFEDLAIQANAIWDNQEFPTQTVGIKFQSSDGLPFISDLLMTGNTFGRGIKEAVVWGPLRN